MKHFNVPALDGIPGIMPGTITVPTPPEFEDEEPTCAPKCEEKSSNIRRGANIPKHKRRMMPCNKKEKD